MTKTLRSLGVYRSGCEIHLEAGMVIKWEQISSDKPPPIPDGSGVEIDIRYEEVDYLHGSTGVVWATYDLRQAETIKAALLAQSIACEVREHALRGAQLHLLCIAEAHEISAAVDFIWREPSGLRLQPDWWYPAGAENESFKKWINVT